MDSQVAAQRTEEFTITLGLFVRRRALEALGKTAAERGLSLTHTQDGSTFRFRVSGPAQQVSAFMLAVEWTF